jgi:hypothetical protein
METRQLNIEFSDSPDKEISLIRKELSLAEIANQVEHTMKDGTPMDEATQIAVAKLVIGISDMFSTNLPSLGYSPEETLRAASREINVSRILRERGYARIYRLKDQKNKAGYPVYLDWQDGEGSPFKRQEDFISWFSKEAHVSRSTMFMRFAAYDRLLAIGFTLEDAYKTTLTKPYAIREVLGMVGTYNTNGELVNVEPGIVKKVAEKMLQGQPEQKKELVSLAEKYQETNHPRDRKALLEVFRPIVKNLIEELSEHESTRDMMDFVRHDILKRPEIYYSWQEDVLIVTIIHKALDPMGTEYILEVEDIPFVPDRKGGLAVPKDVIDDMTKALPMQRKGRYAQRRLPEMIDRSEEKEEEPIEPF